MNIKMRGIFMRKLQTFEAYLDTFETITAYLNKSYYQGESQSFRLKDETLKRQRY